MQLLDAKGGLADARRTGDAADARHPASGPDRRTPRGLLSLVNHLPGMAYRCRNNAQWTMLFVSAGCAELTGYPPEALLDSQQVAYGELIHLDDRQCVWDDVQQALATRRAFQLTYRLRTSAGDYKWVWEQGHGIFDDAGGLLALEGFITDITPRVRAEAAVREAEAQYRSIFEHAVHGMYRSSPGGQFLAANPALARMLGYESPAEFIKHCADIQCDFYADPERRAEIARALEEQGGTGVGFESRLRCRDGATVWARESIHTVRDAVGATLFYEGSVEDITARKAAERAQRESEERYRELFENANDIIYTADLKGYFTSVNKAGETISGYSREEFCGMHFTQLTAPEFVAEAVRMRQRKVAGEELTTRYETEIVTRDGRRVRLEVSTQLVHQHGRPVGVQGIARDITDRVRAEEALRVSEEKFRSIVETTNEWIWSMDAAGHSTYDNPALESILGFRPEEFIGIDTSVHMHPEDRARMQLMLPELAAEKRGWSGLVCRWRHKDGLERYLESSAAPILGINGELLGYRGTDRDITERVRADAKLQASEERYRELLENANDIVYTHDLAGNFTSLNKTGERITGYPQDEALCMNMAQVVAPEHLELAHTMIGRKDDELASTRYELDIIAKDGRRVSLEVSTRLVRQHGQPVAVQGIARDITERKLAEEALRASEVRFLKAFNASPEPMVISGHGHWRYLYVNDSFVSATGYAREEAIGRSTAELNLWADPADGPRFMRMLDAGGRVHREEVNFRLKTGEVRTGLFSAEIIDVVGERCVLSLINDITERKRAEERLLHHAHHDALTGLPNRARFTAHLEAAVAHARRDPAHLYAVLFLDLDRFKNVNDSLGHTVGDQLLVALARRLEHCLRPSDSVARLGGDEFAILVDHIDHEGEAIRVAERVQQELTQPFTLNGHEVFTTASIGIALSITGYHASGDVLRDADTAMYRAKAQGKARHEVFDLVMHARAVSLLRLENDLRRAVERQEFCLHYQPIIDLHDQSICGFEALVRWQHPQRGLIAPAEFIPLAEETGLIVPLGQWVLREACRQMRAWQESSPALAGLKLSVNLSGRQFSQSDLFGQITRALDDTGFDPRRLQLEITVSVLVENAATIVKTLTQLRDLGIELALDDFGTGYSSLSDLHRFPIHTLKIDRSFISPHGGGEHSEIVRTIIRLARDMGKEVVAEGIETPAQLAQLQTLNCPYGQGYLFSPPQDAAGIAALLEAGLPLCAPAAMQ